MTTKYLRKSYFNFSWKLEFRSELSYYNCLKNHVRILVGIQFHDSLVSYGRMISILTIYLSLNNMCQIYPSEVFFFFQYLVKWFHKRHFHAIYFQQYFQSLITRQFRFLTFPLGKVHTFWEGHKILRNLPLTFVYSTAKRILERLGIQTSSSFVKIW